MNKILLLIGTLVLLSFEAMAAGPDCDAASAYLAKNAARVEATIKRTRSDFKPMTNAEWSNVSDLHQLVSSDMATLKSELAKNRNETICRFFLDSLKQE